MSENVKNLMEKEKRYDAICLFLLVVFLGVFCWAIVTTEDFGPSERRTQTVPACGCAQKEGEE